jgi:hypothetical protein
MNSLCSRCSSLCHRIVSCAWCEYADLLEGVAINLPSLSIRFCSMHLHTFFAPAIVLPTLTVNSKAFMTRGTDSLSSGLRL